MDSESKETDLLEFGLVLVQLQARRGKLGVFARAGRLALEPQLERV